MICWCGRACDCEVCRPARRRDGAGIPKAARQRWVKAVQPQPALPALGRAGFRAGRDIAHEIGYDQAKLTARYRLNTERYVSLLKGHHVIASLPSSAGPGDGPPPEYAGVAGCRELRMIAASRRKNSAAEPGILGVLRIGEYRALWSGQVLSVIGDQWARVALTILVYERTRSPLWTALTYAGSYLPWLVGGLALSGFADRFPRRVVLLSCDLARCALLAVMAAPGMSLAAMVTLLYAVTFLDAPFAAARSATNADILPEVRYPLGVALAASSTEAAIVAGFASGGLFVGTLGARAALLADAVTFAVSAACIWVGLAARPAAAASWSPARQFSSGIRLVFGARVPRTMMLFGWLAAFSSVPEALAVPFAARLSGGAAAAGLVFAAGPLGAAVAMPVFARLASRDQQVRWMAPMAVMCCLVLTLCLARPGLAWSLVIFSTSGALNAYQVTANARFVAAIPSERRGHAFGVATAGMFSALGVAFLLAGAAAAAVPPAIVIAIFGAAGTATAMVLAVGQDRCPDTAAQVASPHESE